MSLPEKWPAAWKIVLAFLSVSAGAGCDERVPLIVESVQVCPPASTTTLHASRDPRGLQVIISGLTQNCGTSNQLSAERSGAMLTIELLPIPPEVPLTSCNHQENLVLRFEEDIQEVQSVRLLAEDGSQLAVHRRFGISSP